jgi:hypothetical protein
MVPPQALQLPPMVLPLSRAACALQATILVGEAARCVTRAPTAAPRALLWPLAPRRALRATTAARPPCAPRPTATACAHAAGTVPPLASLRRHARRSATRAGSAYPPLCALPPRATGCAPRATIALRGRAPPRKTCALRGTTVPRGRARPAPVAARQSVPLAPL